LQVFVRVTPRSARDGVEGVTDGVDGPALKVRVRAITDKGAANRAVETVLADWLGIARSSVSVAAGGKSRLKALEVAGEPADLQRLLRARLGDLAE
jgi:uncharacterized protein YggU (UPF0235/DUF167 family)